MTAKQAIYKNLRRHVAPLVPRSGMSRIGEGRNGGGADACSVGLAKEQIGRAVNGTVQKSSVQIQFIIYNFSTLAKKPPFR